MKSAQTGFTQEMLNMIGYIIDIKPGPILIIYPTEHGAIRFSKRKLNPMLRDTPRLKGKVSDLKKKDGENSTLEKSFPGGFISMVGAKSVNSLSQQSIMYLMLDELDRIERTAGNEGDTVEVAAKRLQGYKEVSKQVNISTPTIKNVSRIERKYFSSDQRKYFVPCPVCNHYQTLKWEQVKGWRIDKGVYEPKNTYYECENENCRAQLTEKDKYRMIESGEWRTQNPEVKDHAGFHINELYSTLSTWEDVVTQFIKKKDDPAELQTFVNLVLGETWEDTETTITDNILLARVEDYTSSKLPEGIVLVTAAVDIQGDRAEVLIKGWGVGEESWYIELERLMGDPKAPYSNEPSNLWYKVETYLEKIFVHSSGLKLRISAVGIDTGYLSTSVQRFVKRMHKKGKKHIFALQGKEGNPGSPVLNRPTTNNKLGIKQFTVGTFTAKTIIFSRLMLDEYGPGYMHFNQSCDEEYFKQLTAEKTVTVYDKGIPIKKKWIKIRARNEALDLEVYNLAALDFTTSDLEAISKDFQMKAERFKEENKNIEDKQETTSTNENKDLRQFRQGKQVRLIRKRNFVTNW